MIVEAIKYVDLVVPQLNRDKKAAFNQYHFDAMFVGDDWKGSEIFDDIDAYMKKYGGEVVYIPYTKNISSTILKQVLIRIYGDEKNE